MANTYNLIASNTLASNAASVTFSSIPSTYTDLVLKLSTRTTLAGLADGILLTINGTTGAIVSTKTIQGNGTTTTSFSNPSTSDVYSGDTNGNTSTALTFGNTEVYITNYATTTNAKSFNINHSMENNSTTAYLHTTAGLWNNTGAITSITVTRGLAGSSSYAAGSSFFLYGIKNS